MDEFETLLRETLLVTATLALPVLAVATLVGAAIAVLQAATQVQEQTLSLLPKILAVGALIALFGRAALELCGRLFLEAIARIPGLVHG
jgi:flagellar biosynthetic protein FliQ